MRGLAHGEREENCVQDGDAADQVAKAPVGEHRDGCAVGVRVGHHLGEAAQKRGRGVADGVGDKARDNPAADHAGAAAGDEEAATVRGHDLGKDRVHDGDAGADA